MRLPGAVVDILTCARTIAVVGLSSNPARPSFGVARYLQQQGYRIVPVNPREREVLGEPAYGDLGEAAAAVGAIEIVDVFRRAEHVPAVAAAAIAIGARLLWLQEGVAHAEAEAAARAAGLQVVSSRCLLKQHARLTVAAREED